MFKTQYFFSKKKMLIVHAENDARKLKLFHVHNALMTNIILLNIMQMVTSLRQPINITAQKSQ